MSRHLFLERLRAGLRGLPAETIDEIAADYGAHFADGQAAGDLVGVGIAAREQRKHAEFENALLQLNLNRFHD